MIIHLFSFLRIAAEIIAEARGMQRKMALKHGWMAE
jgi:hypothetical protein